MLGEGSGELQDQDLVLKIQFRGVLSGRWAICDAVCWDRLRCMRAGEMGSMGGKLALAHLIASS